MSIPVTGFVDQNGAIRKYDYDSLENAPVARGTGTNSLIGVNTINPNTATGAEAISLGGNNQSTAPGAVTIGTNNVASAQNAIAIGSKLAGADPNTASAPSATALGLSCTASGYGSVATGYNTTSSGTGSTSMGYQTSATLDGALSSGYLSTASGAASAAIGYQNTASGTGAAAVGRDATASGAASTALGRGTTASASQALAAGRDTKAEAIASTALGYGTDATGARSLVAGAYNEPDVNEIDTTHGSGARKYLIIIGNGTADNARSNAVTLDWDGNLEVAGDVVTKDGSFSELKSAISDINSEVFTATSRISIATDNISYNWYLDGTGKCVNAGSDSGHRMGKYEVTPGEIIWLKVPKITGGTYQWQTSKSVPSSLPNSNLVGTPVTTAVDGLVIVPDDATWLIFTYTSETELQSGIFEYTSLPIENATRIQNVNYIVDYSTGFSRAEPTAVADNYGLTTDGYAVYNNQFQLNKYTVSAGDEIYVIANAPWGGKASYIFTNRSNVSSSNLDHLVGEPITTYVNQKVIVPEGAIFIVFSCLKTDTVSGVYTSLPIENATRIQNAHDELESYMNGFVFDVNKATADDGKNYGPTRFDFPIFRGQKITITNNQAGDNNWTCDIRDSADADLQRISVSKGETKTAIVDVDGGAYLRVYQNVYPLVGRIVAESKVEYNYRMSGELAGVVGDTTDIVKLNYKVPALLQSAQKPTYGQTTVPLSLLHFSDPHGGSTNVARMIEIANAIGSQLDDIICTGDMVNNTYADGFAWWGNIAGAEKILTCIGNHDVSDGTSYNKYGITTQEAYNTYFAPYIANWEVTHTGTNTYYYKDYASKKIRLIVLDYLLEGDDATAQNTWLQSALSGAKTNGYTVVIAQHCQMSNFQSIPSNFTMVYKMTSYQYPTIYQASVQSFIDDGGEFACYIAGHTHWDMLCINPDYPDQICICVTCTAITGRDNDQIRVGGTKSQDGANIVTIDTTSKTVKLIRVGADIDSYLRPRNVLSISYADKTLFAQN